MANRNFKPIIKILKQSSEIFLGYPHRRHRKNKRKTATHKSKLMEEVKAKEHEKEIYNHCRFYQPKT